MRGVRVGLCVVLACLLIVNSAAGDAAATTRSRDVYFEVDEDFRASAAAFDQRTGYFIAVLQERYKDRIDVVAFDPGRSVPVWTRTIVSIPSPSPYTAPANGFSSEILVARDRPIAYIGGAYFYGQAQAGMSAGFIHALDTRTGEQAWSHTDPPQPGTGASYAYLAQGPDGSVIAAKGTLVRDPMNVESSYATTLTAFDRLGVIRWSWTDTRRATPKDVVVTRSGIVAFVGQAFKEDQRKPAYRVALDATTGRFMWRAQANDTQSFMTVASSRDGRTLYLGGEAKTSSADHTFSATRAVMYAVSAEEGKRRWSRYFGPKIAPSRQSRYTTEVVETRSGPCFTGSHLRYTDERESVYPDNGFIACYSPDGRARWIDARAGGREGVMALDGDRLLWSGRQEVKRDDFSDELLRFQVRSVKDGSIVRSSVRSSGGYVYTPTLPLVAAPHRGAAHFLFVTSIPRGLIDRVVW